MLAFSKELFFSFSISLFGSLFVIIISKITLFYLLLFHLTIYS
jgi:hypothetical protein